MPKKPKLHKKPTSEELQENMDKAVKELDKPEAPKKDVKEKPKKVDEPKEDVKETVPFPEVDDDVNATPEVPEEESEVEPKKKSVPKEDDKQNGEPEFKKRYRDSTREAQLLASKNKKLTEAIENAGDIQDPTKRQLTAEYPEWEEMSDFEQKIAKDNLLNRMKFDAITEVTKDFKDMDKWVTKVDEFVKDPITIANYPELDGKEDSFKLFSAKASRRGIDFEDLVSAFMYEEDSKPKKSKGAMFETGTGGDNKKMKPKSDKISLEDSINLRNTDYKKYLKYVKAGKIDTSEL